MTFVLWCKLVVSSKVTSYAVYRGTYRGTDLRTVVYRGTEIRRGTHPYCEQYAIIENSELPGTISISRPPSGIFLSNFQGGDI